jgi:sodium/hydrogen antiporter
MLTWVVFGGPVLGRLLDRMTWSSVIYAALSLTVIRIAPVSIRPFREPSGKVY